MKELVAFLMTFNTGLAPVVGHQVTLDADHLGSRESRYKILCDRADAGDCDLVAHGLVGGFVRSFLYEKSRSFQSDRSRERYTEERFTKALQDGAVVTVTAVPPGSGRRIAIDRDEDGHLDRDEIDASSDPADPRSVPEDH